MRLIFTPSAVVKKYLKPNNFLLRLSYMAMEGELEFKFSMLLFLIERKVKNSSSTENFSLPSAKVGKSHHSDHFI